MQISVTFRNLEPSDNLREYAELKLQKLEKYSDGPMNVNVVLRAEKFRNSAEVIVSGDGVRAAAREVQDEIKAAIDLVSDKIERQLKKFREKQKSKRGNQPAPVVMSTHETDQLLEEEFQVINIEKMNAKPMSVEEAVDQFQIMGKAFLVFINADSDQLNVLYWRGDGTLGLIEP